jgi:hypothetical protein
MLTVQLFAAQLNELTQWVSALLLTLKACTLWAPCYILSLRNL